jgi:hypothetical protein
VSRVVVTRRRLLLVAAGGGLLLVSERLPFWHELLASGSWVVAPPRPPVRRITDAPTTSINLTSANDPLVVQDTVSLRGGDSAFLIQPGAPGRTLLRCQALDVAAGNKVSYGKHAVYAKARGLTVLDFSATASAFAASGLSVRYANFHAERFELDGFDICLTYFEENPLAGTVLFKNGRGVFTRTGAWLSLGAGTRVTPDFVFDNVQLQGPGKFIGCDPGLLDGTVTIQNGCMWRAQASDPWQPVSADMCQNIPPSKLTIK